MIVGNLHGKRVLVVQRRMTHYRVKFFELLRARLEQEGCELILAYGQGTSQEAQKDDSAEIPWAVKLPTKYFFGGRVCWQPFGNLLNNADVVVVTAENKLIYNLVVQLLVQKKKKALWGHGANLQGNKKSLRERFKKVMALHADWWFAYTERSAALVRATGFDPLKITVLNNSVDTTEVRIQIDRMDARCKVDLKKRFDVGSNNVGVFVGSLYPEKRLDFLVDAADLIRKKVQDFELLIVGDGPDSDYIQSAATTRPWLHYFGALKGGRKVEVISLAKVFLNPGLVGLGVLDSFACRVPLVTTDCELHSPEISYLQNGHNGLIVDNTLEAYSSAVTELLLDGEKLNRLVVGCERDYAIYTLEGMVDKFAGGLNSMMAPASADLH